MPVPTNAGFDLTVELDQAFVTRLAQASLALDSPPRSLGDDPWHDELTGVAEISPTLAYIWFNQEPPAPEGLNRSRTTDDHVSFGLDLGAGRLDIRTILLRIGPLGIPVPILFNLGSIPLRGRIDVTDCVETRELTVRDDRANPQSTTDAFCVVIDFAPDAAGAAGPHPDIVVRLDEKPILDAPLSRLRSLQALLFGGPKGVEAAQKALIADIASRLRQGVADALSSLIDWRIGKPGVVPLRIEPKPQMDPPGFLETTQLVTRTLGTSLYVFAHTDGSGGGNAALLSRTQLPPGGALAITIQNWLLLRGIVRPGLVKELPGLINGYFVGDHPCALAQPVKITPAGGESFALRALSAIVDESSRIRIAGTLRRYIIADVFVDVDFQLFLSLHAEVTVQTGQPSLLIHVDIPAADRQVTRVQISTTIDLQLLETLMPMGALGLPIWVEAPLNVIGGIPIKEAIEDQLANLGPPGGQAIPLPAGADLRLGALALHQSDSQQAHAYLDGAVRPMGRAHDLVITLNADPLPARLEIECATPNAADVVRRVSAVGGTLADGRRWGMPVDDAIGAVSAERLTLVIGAPPAEAVLEVAEGPNQTPFLRVQGAGAADGGELAALPPCP